jgi:Lrp/AsnC family transcriptional regulator of ectoine degradation
VRFSRTGASASRRWPRPSVFRTRPAGSGYRAEIDLKRIVHAEFFIVDVTLQSHGADDFRRFESEIDRIPEIIRCDAVGGGVDYIMQVVARDIDHYQALIDALLAAEVGIARYFTYAVTKPVKRAAEYPLEHLIARSQSD